MDIWSFDNGSWEKKSEFGPAGRGWSLPSYVKSLGALVVFGGIIESNFVDETWLWDGKKWSLDSDSSPGIEYENGDTLGSIGFTSFGYNPVDDSIVLLLQNGQTWEYRQSNSISNSKLHENTGR